MFQVTHKRITLFLASTIALVVVGCGGAEAAIPTTQSDSGSSTEKSPLSTINESEAVIWLEAPVGTHQTGWARVWEKDGALFVEVDVSPPSAVAQPAHIHKGECTGLGIIDYRLENIIGGHSLSELEGLSLRDVATGKLAINLHASFADFSTFTACGEIPLLGGSSQSSPIEPLEQVITEPDSEV